MSVSSIHITLAAILLRAYCVQY